MVSAFKKDVLNYISVVHCVPSYQGATELHRVRKDTLPEHRTIYRWHRELKGMLDYYPSMDFSSLGLIHAHVILSGVKKDLSSFPIALEQCWLMPRPGERFLYIHCAITGDFRVDFKKVLTELKGAGYFTDYVDFYSLDGWQIVQELSNCFDSNGRIRVLEKDPYLINRDSFKKSHVCTGLLKSYPLVVPIIFENYGKRRSLLELWKYSKKTLGRNVWKYIPRGIRRMPVNGKGYVKRAFKLLGDWHVFRQNIICYKPLLDNSVEVFIMLITKDKDRLYNFIEKMRSFCPIVQFYPGLDNVSLLRVTGDTTMIYALIELFPEITYNEIEIFYLDKKRTWAMEGTVVNYASIFDPRNGEWTFKKENILEAMKVKEHAR